MIDTHNAPLAAPEPSSGRPKIQWLTVLTSVAILAGTVVWPVRLLIVPTWSLTKQVTVAGGWMALVAGVLAALLASSNAEKHPRLHDVGALSLAILGILAGALALRAGLIAPDN